ncbi:hypothetical protein QQM79_01900 [Marinobacteraceae bacterium S3BR75-40.1]
MEWYLTLLLQFVVTVVAVFVAAMLFHRLVLKPFLDAKVEDLRKISEEVEPRVQHGVKKGMRESLREIPETSWRDATRQVTRFGTELLEEGISTFLGGVEPQRRGQNGKR